MLIINRLNLQVEFYTYQSELTFVVQLKKICSNRLMENNNKQTNETASSNQGEEIQKNPESTGRLNIDDINKRNIEERKKEKKSLYILTGILAVLLIIVAIFFFN